MISPVCAESVFTFNKLLFVLKQYTKPLLLYIYCAAMCCKWSHFGCQIMNIHFYESLLTYYTFRWRQSTGGYVFSVLLLLYIMQVGSLIIWLTDTGQSLSAEVCST